MFDQIFNDALRKDNQLSELRQEIIKLRSLGVDKQVILSELQSFRSKTTNEAEEDIILEVMDFLKGFCSSHMRID